MPRRVHFPEGLLVTGSLEPPSPWAAVEEVSAEELLEDYKKSCLKHNTEPLECLIIQLKSMGTIGGPTRHGTLTLAGSHLTPEACEALETIFKKARFQRIDLHDCQLNDDAAVALFDMVEYYESAAELDISGNKGFGILAWQACSRMVNKCQWLEQLEVREISLIESTAPVLGRGLRNACSLRSLHLQRSHLSGPPLLCLAGFLKQNKSVRELHLGDNQLVASDAKYLASMLKTNSSLQLLDISNNDIQDTGVEAIADALAEQSSAQSSSSESSSESPMSSPQSGSSSSSQERGLAVLVVWNNNLTRNSGKHFSKALSRCRSLEVLNIGQNPLCGETVNRLRSALQQNRSLLSLGMQSTRLGAEAAVALAEVIEDNPVLQRIDLRDNKLQSAGLLALATALKKNQSVTRIDLDDAPPIQTDKEQPLEEARLVNEIRLLCNRNEAQNNSSLLTDDDESLSLHRKRNASFTTRKISLTCQTLHTPTEPVLSPPKLPSGRLKSPLPSPIPSPMSSPIPSPSHKNRFQVSRVSDSSSGTSQSPSPSTPPGPKTFFPGNSRFRVFQVMEPPSISVQGPEDSLPNMPIPITELSKPTEESRPVKCANSRFSVTRNVDPRSNNSNLVIKKAWKANDDISESQKTLNPTTKPNTNNTNTETKLEKVVSDIDLSKKAIDQIASIDQNLGDLIDEMKDISEKASRLKIKNNSEVSSKQDIINPEKFSPKCTANTIKKNKSESSLDSPDLEVSRLMQEKRNTYDSSSSLDISGSSMESLNTLEVAVVNKNTSNDSLDYRKKFDFKQTTSTDYSLDSEEGDVFISRDGKFSTKLCNLSASSNESSLDLSAPVEVPLGNIFQFNQSFLNSSVSSNESVSPNIFGKHMKLHGSVTSLEASVSSLDSCKSGVNTLVSPTLPNVDSFIFPLSDQSYLIDSTDSGIFQSDNSPKTANSSLSSNDGTITSNSNLSKMVQSIESSLELHGNTAPSDNDPKVPKRTSSLLDVPSSASKQRTRKISWVMPPGGLTKKENDEPQQQKAPSSLEKLLNLFQNPGSLFSRSVVDSDKKDSNQSSSRRDSQNAIPGTSGSFWPWNLSSGIGSSTSTKILSTDKLVSSTDSSEESNKSEKNTFKSIGKSISSVSAEYTVKLAGKKHSIEDTSTSADITINEGSARSFNANFNPLVINKTVSSEANKNIEMDSTAHTSFYEIGNDALNESVNNTGECTKYSEMLLENLTINTSADDAVNDVRRLSIEHEVLHCDNLGEIEETCSSSVHLNMTHDDRHDVPSLKTKKSDDRAEDTVATSVSVEKCDNKKVQLNVELMDEVCTDNVTMLSAIRDDGTITKNTVQNNLLLGVCDTNQEFDGITRDFQDDDGCLISNNVFDNTNNDETNTELALAETMLDDSFDMKANIDMLKNLKSTISEDAEKHVDGENHDFQASDDIPYIEDLNPLLCSNDSVISESSNVSYDEDKLNMDDGEKNFKIPEPYENSAIEVIVTENIPTLHENALMESIDSNIYKDSQASNINLTSLTEYNDALEKIDNSKDEYKIINDVYLPRIESENVTLLKGNCCTDIEYAIEIGVLKDSSTQVSEDENLENILIDDNFNIPFSQQLNKSDKNLSNFENVGSVLNISQSLPFMKTEVKETIRPTSFTIKSHNIEINDNIIDRIPPPSILKQSIGLENKSSPGDRQLSPESGPSVENLPSKIIKKIKENISPENTLTSSMSNTQALAQELAEKRKILGLNQTLFRDTSDLNIEMDPKHDKKSEDLISILDELQIKDTHSVKNKGNTAKLEIDIQSDLEESNMRESAFKDKNVCAKRNNSERNKKNLQSFDSALQTNVENIEKKINSDASDIAENMKQSIPIYKIDDSKEKCVPIQAFEKFTSDTVDEFNSFQTIYDNKSDMTICLKTATNEENIFQINEGPNYHEPGKDASELEITHFDCEYPCLCLDNSNININSTSSLSCSHKIQEYSCENIDSADKILETNQLNLGTDTQFPIIEEAKDALTIDLSHDLEKSNINETVLQREDTHISALTWDNSSIISSDLYEKLNEDEIVAFEIQVSEASQQEKKDSKPISILKQKKFESMQYSSPQDIPDQKKSFYEHSDDKFCGSCEKNAPVRCGSLPECISGYSPKSLPDNLTARCKTKSRSPINIGKLARDSLHALNKSEDDLIGYGACKRLPSLDSVKSLGSVSEDGEEIFPLRRGCSSSESRSLGPCTSQESLASLASISETAGESENIEISKDSDKI